MTVVDDEDGTHLDFMGGPSPHSGPPDVGSAVDGDQHPTSSRSGCDTVLRENATVEEDRKRRRSQETVFMNKLLEEIKEMMNPDFLDEETALMMKRMVVIRISTKHINLWIRQLEMKRKVNVRAGRVDEIGEDQRRNAKGEVS